jgi:carboxylesterase type B
MEWISKHIAAFGGDPNQVTLFGESAGAYDIGFHLVQPGSFPYYKRAIMESYGDTQTEHISMDFAQNVYGRVLAKTSCDNLACLRKKTTEELTAADKAIGNPTSTSGKWNPVIDGIYNVGTGWELIQQGHFNDKAQVLLGANHDEASILTGSMDIIQGVLPAAATEEDFDSFLDTLQVSPALNATQKAHVKSLYAWGTYDDYPAYLGAAPSMLGGGNLSKWWWAATMVQEDAASPHTTGYCTHRRMAKHLTEKIDTYLYIWAHPPQYKELNNSLPGSIIFGPHNSMVPHGSELRYVFNAMNGQYGYAKDITPMDRAVGLATASSWAAFAATGNPSSSKFAHAFKGWEKYSNSEDKTYYMAPSLDSFEGGTMRKVRSEQCDYWATLKTSEIGPEDW